MRKALIVALGLVLAPSLALCFNPPTGFRGIAFGSDPSALGQNVSYYDNAANRGLPNMARYVRYDENLDLGGVAIWQINYFYHQDRLALVEIRFSDNYDGLLAAMVKAYGQPTKVTTDRYGLKSYQWGKEKGDDVVITLDHEEWIARIAYVPIFAPAMASIDNGF